MVGNKGLAAIKENTFLSEISTVDDQMNETKVRSTFLRSVIPRMVKC